MRAMTMREKPRTRAGAVSRAEKNLEKALETISKRLLEQIREGQTPGKELAELAKVLKQAVEIRQALQEDGKSEESGVRVEMQAEAEEYAG